ncbi:hypothetical protein FOXYSP1_19457 [Fusarium oxysporum f. sp. phaseoli]
MVNSKILRPGEEKHGAECPFKISNAPGPAAPQQQERQKNKERKRDGQDDDKRVYIQASPFFPTGDF